LTDITIPLDQIDLRLLEVYADNLRKVMNLKMLRIEDAALFCVKRALYNEDKVDPKGTGH
jgi:hypothetical protein